MSGNRNDLNDLNLTGSNFLYENEQSHSLPSIRTKDIPYVPTLVDITDLKENFCLLAEQKQNLIFPNMNILGKYSKKNDLDLRIIGYSIVVLNSPHSNQKEYYAIYKGKQGKVLGEGGCGKVKLAQNLVTGEWVALKIQGFNSLQNEENTLKAVNQFYGSYRYFSQYNLAKKATLMKLGQGPNLDTIRVSNKKYSSIFWLNLAEQQATAISSLYDQNILHRDIKDSNFIYLPQDNKVIPIDFGYSVVGKEIKEKIVGTVIFLAPELISDNEVEYNEKTEVFSLGLSIAEMLGLAIDDEQKNKDKKGFKLLTFSEAAIKSKIKDPAMREIILQFLSKTVAFKPEDRPTLQKVRDFFKDLKETMIDIPTRLTKIGFINVSEFAATEKNKRYWETLSAMDEIYLIDTAGSEDHTLEYIKIKQALERKGLFVKNKVIVSLDQAAIPDTLNRHITELNNGNFAFYTGVYISSDKNISDKRYPFLTLLDPQLQSRRRLACLDKKLINKTNQDLTSLVEIKRKISKNLLGEVSRLKNKYNTESPSAAHINVRIGLIDSLYKEIKNDLDYSMQNHNNETIDFTKLLEKLNDLQQRLHSKNCFTRFCEEWLGYNSTTSFQQLRFFKEEVRQASKKQNQNQKFRLN